MKFEWDPKMADMNLRIHGVSFDEAKTVFGDPLARIFDVEVHSFEEKRSAIFGHSETNRLLMVSFTERENDTIRLISARRATPRERRLYDDQT
ncbi:MAG TPA: BrnT family toxin [Pyrinomonadaceae bacterium]|nr:BrnT family toxin [Pyrinomonadaceae bacterium]